MPELNCPTCTGPVALVADGVGSRCPSCQARFGAPPPPVAAGAETFAGAPEPDAERREEPVPPNPFSRGFMVRYEMAGFLGKGAMGAVFLMRQLALDRLVAVKAVRGSGLTPKENRRLIKEAKVLAKLAHPAIRAIYDTGIDGAVPYMVCEYVDGETLSARLARGGALLLPEALRIALGVLDGLEYAHRQGVVHRDLKPGNILLDREGRAKLVDFGLATMSDMNTIETVSGRILGTPRYMSPEQVDGQDTTAASDIYAMGVVLYELVTGKLPYEGPGPMNYMEQHLNATPRTVTALRPELPSELDAITARALAKSPGERFESATAFYDAVMDVYSQLTGVRFMRPVSSVAGAVRVGPPAAPAAETVLADRYRLVRKLGQSALGEMWLAHDQALDGAEVAVRLIPERIKGDAAAHAVLVREARNALKLAHTNVVRVFHFEPGARPFLVREFVTGPSLATELARRTQEHARPFSAPEALAVLEGIVAGVEHAHQRGVLHRDLNPANVVLEASESGTMIPRVTDFGLAAAVQCLPAHVPGAAERAYRSPEQLAGEAADVRSDVYALGAVLFHMLTLEPPAFGMDGEVEWPAGKPPEPAAAAAVVRAALSCDPAARPTSAVALLEAFHAAVAQRPAPAPPGLTRHVLFQLVADEVFKDGVVEESENRALVELTEYLQLPREEARNHARSSLERFRQGKLGSKRRLDARTLYSKALYFAHTAGGPTPEQDWMLEGLRKILHIGFDVHAELLARVMEKL